LWSTRVAGDESIGTSLLYIDLASSCIDHRSPFLVEVQAIAALEQRELDLVEVLHFLLANK
jgi:hypothetical protein